MDQYVEGHLDESINFSSYDLPTTQLSGRALQYANFTPENFPRFDEEFDLVAKLEVELVQAIENLDQVYKVFGVPLETLVEENPFMYDDFVPPTGIDKSQVNIGSQDELNQQRQKLKELFRVNKGYAFVTFSHTQEAKRGLMLSENTMLGESFVDVFLKNDIDHGDFDIEYVRGRMKSDAMMLAIKEDLLEAKKELNEFEQNFDSFMPNMRKIQIFKDSAKDLIDQDINKD